MVPFFPLVALPVVIVAAGLVYADTVRRGLRWRTRLWWTGLVLSVSLVGFVAVFTFDASLSGLYFEITGQQVVVHSPRELLVGLLAVGLAVSSASVFAYGLGSRFGPFEASDRV